MLYGNLDPNSGHGHIFSLVAWANRSTASFSDCTGPPYSYPGNAWRKLINKIVAEKAEKAGIQFAKNDKLEVEVKLYMGKALLKKNDVDNRLKDILDAIQGRAGGSKTIHKLKAVVPNDNQIYRASIEKMAPSKQSHGLGHLIIRLFRN